MKPKSFTSQAVVLSRKDYSDYDRIINLFSKDFGKLILVAKGIKKPKSKKRGHLEVFNNIKFSGVRGRDLDLIIEAELIDNYSRTRTDLRKMSVAYYFIEVINKLTHQDEKHEEVYDLLVNYLKALEISKDLKNLRKGFVRDVLVLMGYWPHGLALENPDSELEKITERKLNSERVGKKVLSNI